MVAKVDRSGGQKDCSWSFKAFGCSLACLLACLAVCRFETEFPGKRNPDRRSRLHLGSFNPLDSWIFPHPSATRIFATPPCHATTRKENISKPSEESGSPALGSKLLENQIPARFVRHWLRVLVSLNGSFFAG